MRGESWRWDCFWPSCVWDWTPLTQEREILARDPQMQILHVQLQSIDETRATRLSSDSREISPERARAVQQFQHWLTMRQCLHQCLDLV